MEECYEYFNCDSVDCSKRSNPDENCWNLGCDLQHAHSSAVSFLREEMECKKKHVNSVSITKNKLKPNML